MDFIIVNNEFCLPPAGTKLIFVSLSGRHYSTCCQPAGKAVDCSAGMVVDYRTDFDEVVVYHTCKGGYREYRIIGDDLYRFGGGWHLCGNKSDLVPMIVNGGIRIGNPLVNKVICDRLYKAGDDPCPMMEGRLYLCEGVLYRCGGDLYCVTGGLVEWWHVGKWHEAVRSLWSLNAAINNGEAKEAMLKDGQYEVNGARYRVQGGVARLWDGDEWIKGLDICDLILLRR